MYQTANYSSAGGRSYNEDSVGVIGSNKGSVCIVVADGLGGHGGGDLASQKVRQTVLDNWDGLVSGDQLAALLQKAHEEICSIQTPQCAMKSTAAVLTVRGKCAAWAHIGDTRLYHFYNKELVSQTVDHSASQLAVAMGQISAEQIRFHADRNRLLRALGADDSLGIDTNEETLEEGHHAFLLCTDGFWEYVLEKEMEEDLKLAQKPGDWLHAMRNRLDQRVPAQNDNHSAAVLWMSVE